jgi:hypothetical protein
MKVALWVLTTAAETAAWKESHGVTLRGFQLVYTVVVYLVECLGLLMDMIAVGVSDKSMVVMTG